MIQSPVLSAQLLVQSYESPVTIEHGWIVCVKQRLSICPLHIACGYLFIHDKEGAQAVKIIRLSRALKVVVEITHVGPFADIGNVSFSVGVERKLAQNALVSFACDRGKTFRDITTLHGFGDGVDIHGRAGGLQPVALSQRLIDYLEPAPTRGILVFCICAGELLPLTWEVLRAG
jgi:hypothetical protein